MQLPFYIVDVFATQPLAGNPLAVVIATEDLPTTQMQAIAREMNYSETTFILSKQPTASGYPVRIFTPSQELPFAGHPTLGTASVLRQHVLPEPQNQLNLSLPVGSIPVTVEPQANSQGDLELLWMRQNPPDFGQSVAIADLASVLNLETDAFDARWPIQEVSTGIPFLIVPLKHYAELERIAIDRAAYYRLIEPLAAKAILVYCPEPQSPEHQLAVRVFGEAIGVPEDPATGSANGCLAAYLSQYAVLGTETVNIRVEQGAQLQRPSVLHLRSRPLDDHIEVRVGGQVMAIAQGVLTV